MRFLLAAGFSAFALAVLAVPTGCIVEDCNADCTSTITINAHVPGGPTAVAGARVTFCRNGTCASTTKGDGALQGAPFFPQMATAPRAVDGFTVVAITVDVSKLVQADGDTYSITIVDAAGKTLLDVTRPMLYESSLGCVSDQDGKAPHKVTCKSYTTDVYPTSASGAACASSTCRAGFGFSGPLTASGTGDNVDFSVCRNGTACGKTTIPLPQYSSVGITENLVGELFGTVDLEVNNASSNFDFLVDIHDDPAALHDGDTYTFTATQGGTVVSSFSGVAPYKQLAGDLGCNANPCRTGLVDLGH